MDKIKEIPIRQRLDDTVGTHEFANLLDEVWRRERRRRREARGQFARSWGLTIMLSVIAIELCVLCVLVWTRH
jgi:hypothetical protein